MKLLLAEDDPMIGAGMARGLKLAGFVVDWVRDGRTARAALDQGEYTLLLLDLGLPLLDGVALLKELRRGGRDIPVLVVTARDTVADRISGLNLGADDYLTKPFDLDELIARVHALQRRHLGRKQPEMRLGALCVNPISREATLDARPLPLSQREFSLLAALIEKPGTVLSREQLEDRLYGWEEEVASNAIEVHLHNLRRKLGMAWIRNVRGVGYKLVVPPPEAAA
ncbi:MAG: DNA-binding response regulator [Hydrogenophilales bacterium CG_4_9_14_3_um_filter_63_34]|nr:MAG: DNA-binding response regulator [Hydrogenophilales bacterium CG_4_10_14_3_um_filter_63_21]PJB03406.1 MAG: DNA-binding response regulator [Hydrogenophilales bacterium CG_4_9_14_3_um_filter_63_34]